MHWTKQQKEWKEKVFMSIAWFLSCSCKSSFVFMHPMCCLCIEFSKCSLHYIARSS
uniref:Uncharacterized protein n=1 Tax=Scytodes thoracica TaxID=1112478 RepID=A0A0A0VCR8_SCYTH|nr:hypothetical protein [Scytodes thoracica]